MWLLSNVAAAHQPSHGCDRAAKCPPEEAIAMRRSIIWIGAILDLPQNETAAQSEINWAVTNSVCAPTSKDSGHSSGLSMLRSVRLSIGLCFPPESRWNICSRRTRGQKHSLRHFLHEHLCCELWSIPLWHEASLSPSTQRALWNAGSHTPSLCHPSFLLLAWKISFLKASL